jgi:hypothetical protein
MRGGERIILEDKDALIQRQRSMHPRPLVDLTAGAVFVLPKLDVTTLEVV